MALMEVRQLVKTYGSKQAVKGISFDIHEGRCISLLGPNGAGKTTTLNMISGLLKPTAGSIRFGQIGPVEDLRKYIGYLPQYGAYYNWMSGKEFLVYAGRLAHLEKREAEKRADELLQRVGLEDAKKRRVGGYSGGMKQRLGLAQAMIHRPKLLILDEPVSALDPIGRREVLELLKQLKKETTILFSTHVLPDAEEVSDDVLIIRQGEIVIAGSLQDIRKQHSHPKIELELEPGTVLEEWKTLWKDWSGLTGVQGQTATIALPNMEELSRARTILLSRLAEGQAPVRRVEVAQSTLEDLFMKAVQS